MKEFTTKRQCLGLLGEKLAYRWLLQKGYIIHSVNYSCRKGEIDIICELSGVTHFVEVKSVLQRNDSETTYNPAENVTRKKVLRLLSTIYDYRSSHMVSPNWVLDVVCVFIANDKKQARVQVFENILAYILTD